MENGALNQTNNQKYNFFQMPNFKLKAKASPYSNKSNNKYLCQSQTISNKNKGKEKDNPLTLSIADKIKEMKEELSKENSSFHKNENNDFRMRLERITKGKFGTSNNVNNNELKKSNKEVDFNLMKNKIKTFESQREKEKLQKKNALDDLDDIFNNFRNNRYGN